MARGKYERVVTNRKKQKRMFSFLLSIALLLTLAAGGTLAYVITKSAIAENQFEAGRVTSSVNDSGQVTNTGNVDAYIRAAVVVNWMDSNGNVRGIAPQSSDYELTVSEGWWQDPSTFFYYYTEKVAPDESTSALVSKITVLSTVPDGYELSVEVVAEAIQAEGDTDSGNIPAYQDAWGVSSIGN